MPGLRKTSIPRVLLTIASFGLSISYTFTNFYVLFDESHCLDGVSDHLLNEPPRVSIPQDAYTAFTKAGTIFNTFVPPPLTIAATKFVDWGFRGPNITPNFLIIAGVLTFLAADIAFLMGPINRNLYLDNSYRVGYLAADAKACENSMNANTRKLALDVAQITLPIISVNALIAYNFLTKRRARESLIDLQVSTSTARADTEYEPIPPLTPSQHSGR